MLLVLLALAVALLIALVVVSTRPDANEAIASGLEHLASPWRDLAGRLGFGFTAWYDDIRRTYSIRGSRLGRAVTVEYASNDLSQHLKRLIPHNSRESTSRLKVVVHLLGGLPEGFRVRNDPAASARLADHDDIRTGDSFLDDSLWIGGTVPTVVRTFVSRDDVRALLHELVRSGHGALLTEFELMITHTGDENRLREGLEELVDFAAALAERIEAAANLEWRLTAERWGLELFPGTGGQPPMLQGAPDGTDVRVALRGQGPSRVTDVEVGWNVGLPIGFRITERSARRGEAPEIALDYPPLAAVRVEGNQPPLFRSLLLEPPVAQSILNVVPAFTNAAIGTNGVHVPIPGQADAATLDRAINAALTLHRRLRRQIEALSRAGAIR